MSSGFLERFKHKSNKLGRNGEIIVSEDFKVRKDLNITPTLDKHFSNSSIKPKTQLSSRVLSPIRSKSYLGGVMVDVNNTLKTMPSYTAFQQASNSEFNPLTEKSNRDIVGGVDMSDKSQIIGSMRSNRITMLPAQESYKNLKRDFHIGSYENAERCSRCSNSVIMMKLEDEKKESMYKAQQQLVAGTSVGVNENWNSKQNVESRRRNYSEKILKQRGLHLKGIENTYSLLKQKELPYFRMHKASI